MPSLPGSSSEILHPLAGETEAGVGQHGVAALREGPAEPGLVRLAAAEPVRGQDRGNACGRRRAVGLVEVGIDRAGLRLPEVVRASRDREGQAREGVHRVEHVGLRRRDSRTGPGCSPGGCEGGAQGGEHDGVGAHVVRTSCAPCGLRSETLPGEVSAGTAGARLGHGWGRLRDMTLTREDLDAATAVVRRHFPATPQFAWPLLGREVGAQVWVKHENQTPTGAFKVRGGLVYTDRVVRERPQVRGLVSRHPRQPRPEPRVCRPCGRAARRHRGAGGQQS